MISERSHSQRVLWVFTAVMVLMMAQLSWWVVFQIRSSRQTRAQQIAAWGAATTWAEELIAAKLEHLHDPQAIAMLPQQVLNTWFADLTWQTMPQTNPLLRAAYGDYGVGIKPNLLQTAERIQRSRWRMFVFEGGFFLMMVGLGAVLIVHILRYEMWLLRQQNNFVSAVTHEFRSPLAAIRLFVETMQLRSLPPATQHRYLQAMISDVQRLEHLVNNLLEIVRLEMDKPERLTTAPINIAAFVEQTIATRRDEIQQRGFVLHFACNAPNCVLDVDASLLALVIRNLLDNAIKYSGSSKRIDIALRLASGQLQLSVRDYGIGMAAEDLPHVFKKFFRVGNELQRETPGSGLGLYLVAQAAHRLGAQVNASSDGLQQGSCLSLTWPYAG